MNFTDNTPLISDVISLQIIKDICKHTLKNYPDVSCYLFGSYAKGTPNRSSDLDLLLLFDKEVYEYKIISQIKNALYNDFLAIKKYCNPIYGFRNHINDDSSILFRQYVHYGILVSGQNMLPFMKDETQEELKNLEYTHYWTPMYLHKMESVEQMVRCNTDLENSSLAWQYLFLIAYWYAKAKLTLVDKQNSLNNFSLVYIYEELLKTTLNLQQREVLSIVHKQRENYKACKYFEQPTNISLLHCFEVIKTLLASKK